MAAAISLVNPALAACNYGTSSFPRSAAGIKVNTFGYTPTTGPMHWYQMNKTANVLCAKGRNQSPISLGKSTKIEAGQSLEFKVENATQGAVFENIGTTIQVLVNGTMKVDGKYHNMTQFHFHTPSEHKLRDEYYPMEAHFVFEAEDKSLSVMAFLISLGPTDPLLASIFLHIYDIKSPGRTTRTEPLDFTMLEANVKENLVWRYTGSLTTPPCTEGVKWYISQIPLFVNNFTFERVKRVLKFNSRFTQNKLGQPNLLEESAMEFIKQL
ncbi:Carbonic anhydrase [Cladobotryum mycophilum]|uniref:Carbonic anhydrase n=1 Tax=Cladobotryum mycophilum TaxID=491253 RepID=A0ABR0SJI8_9HYPO